MAEEEGPWRLEEALGFPEWLDFSIQQRTRYEYVDEDFRANRDMNNHLFALRTLVAATVRFSPFRVTGEMMDSRQYGAPDDGFLNTTIVDAVELLQGFLGFEKKDVFSDGDKLDVLVGRHTMDVGSRRLVARNDFRNTINSFTGINAVWEGSGKEMIRAFLVLPVRRLPSDQASLLDNDVEFDEEEEKTLFYGLFGSMPILDDKVEAEAYLFGLDEEDDEDVVTADRQLWTLGTRLRKPHKTGEFSFEWESAVQFGDSRSSTGASNTTDLDHFAHFHHLSVGYQFPGDWKPRLEGLFDYASGDDDPTDDENNRFDTLFGARRWEFGPTGIYGALLRSNLISPGLRLNLQVRPDTQLMLSHRLAYLASDRDAFVPGGQVDPTGDSGSCIGQLAELRIRHDVEPQNFQLELGIAHLFAGDFLRDAPNSNMSGDSTYAYISTILWL